MKCKQLCWDFVPLSPGTLGIRQQIGYLASNRLGTATCTNPDLPLLGPRRIQITLTFPVFVHSQNFRSQATDRPANSIQDAVKGPVLFSSGHPGPWSCSHLCSTGHPRDTNPVAKQLDLRIVCTQLLKSFQRHVDAITFEYSV